MVKRPQQVHTLGMTKQRHVFLKEDERTELKQLIESGTNSARVIARARTLSLLDRSQGKARTIQEVVDAAMISQGTVSNTKKRYFSGGLDEPLAVSPHNPIPTQTLIVSTMTRFWVLNNMIRPL